MTQSAAQLVDEMTDDLKAWMRGKDIDLEAKYRAAIDGVGAVPFLAELFTRFGESTLKGWLFGLIFTWKELPFAAWKEVLHRISRDTDAVYQFVPFATEFLALDIVRVIHEDPAVDETARALAKRMFPKGGPIPDSEWVREQLDTHGVDQHQLWRRLVAEGAPMKVDPVTLAPLERDA